MAKSRVCYEPKSILCISIFKFLHTEPSLSVIFVYHTVHLLISIRSRATRVDSVWQPTEPLVLIKIRNRKFYQIKQILAIICTICLLKSDFNSVIYKFSILFAKIKLRTISINRINTANSQVSNHLNHTSDGPDNQATVGSGFIDDVEVSSISSDVENNLQNEGFLE